jgi:hypothetical protein
MTFGALKDVIAGLVLHGDESVWRDGMPTWQPVTAVPALLPAPKAVDQAVVPLLNQRLYQGLKKFVSTLPSTSASVDGTSPSPTIAIGTQPVTSEAPKLVCKATVTLKKAVVEPEAIVLVSTPLAASSAVDTTSVAAVASPAEHGTFEAVTATDTASTSSSTTAARPPPPPPVNDARQGSVQKRVPPAKVALPDQPASTAATNGDIELTSNPLFQGSDRGSDNGSATAVSASTTPFSQPVVENEVRCRCVVCMYVCVCVCVCMCVRVVC